jgi:hypothetical protein
MRRLQIGLKVHLSCLVIDSAAARGGKVIHSLASLCFVGSLRSAVNNFGEGIRAKRSGALGLMRTKRQER